MLLALGRIQAYQSMPVLISRHFEFRRTWPIQSSGMPGILCRRLHALWYGLPLRPIVHVHDGAPRIMPDPNEAF